MMWRAAILAVGTLLSCARLASAQITISNVASISAVPNAGINLTQDLYYEPAVAANIIENGGMELPAYAQLIAVTAATATTFTSANNTGDILNAWAGATCSIRVGTCADGSNNFAWNSSNSPSTGGCTSGGSNAGQTFTLSGSSTASGADVMTCSGGACPTLHGPSPGASGGNQTDIVSCRILGAYQGDTHSGAGGGSGWLNGAVNDVFFTATKAHQGNGSLEFNNAAAGHNVTQSWDGQGGQLPNVCVAHPATMCTVNGDCPGGDTCSTVAPFVMHPVTGTWQLSFWSNTVAAGGTCTANLVRSGSAAMISNHSFAVGSSNDGLWHQQTFNFAGNDLSSTPNNVMTLTLGCTGGAVFVDDVSLAKTTGASGPFRAETLDIFQKLGAGSVRNPPSHVLSGAITAAAADGNQFTIPPMGESQSIGAFAESEYSYIDQMNFAAAVSSTTTPYLTFPTGWFDSDYTQFGTDVCAQEAIHNFSVVNLECSNENWNSGASGFYKVAYPAYGYGGACARAFQVIAAACGDSRVHYLLDAQTSNGGVVQNYLAGANFNIPNTAQYGISENLYAPLNNLFSLSGLSLSQALTAVAAQNDSELSTALNQAIGDPVYACLKTNSTIWSPCNRGIATYEWSIQEEDPNFKLLDSQINAGFGGAMIGMQDMILALSTANPAQSISTTNLFQLVQPPNGGVLEWQTVAGYAGTNQDFAPVWPQVRPVALGMKLYNQAINGGDYHACASTPAGVKCAAFYKSSLNAYQLALTNRNATTAAITATFPNGTNVPTNGQTVLSNNGEAGNNENSNSVSIGNLPSGVSVSGQQISLTLPAHSANAVLFLTGPTPTPTATATPTVTPTATPTATPTPTSTPTVTPTATTTPGCLQLKLCRANGGGAQWFFP